MAAGRYDARTAEAFDARVNAVCGDLASPRLGLSVSRRVGGAVTRNRVRRRLRELFRRNRDLFGGRDGDLVINVTKAKQLTNMRTHSADDAIVLTPPRLLSLEECLDFIEDDELVEVTPKGIRMRKRLLSAGDRIKLRKRELAS